MSTIDVCQFDGCPDFAANPERRAPTSTDCPATDATPATACATPALAPPEDSGTSDIGTAVGASAIVPVLAGLAFAVPAPNIFDIILPNMLIAGFLIGSMLRQYKQVVRYSHSATNECALRPLVATSTPWRARSDNFSRHRYRHRLP